MKILNSDVFMGKIYFKSIRIYLISYSKIFLHLQKLIFRRKIKSFRFFYVVFKEIFPKFTDIKNSDDIIRKITSKSIRQTTTSFCSKTDTNLIKNRFFPVKK